jgi:hypothetical protein
MEHIERRLLRIDRFALPKHSHVLVARALELCEQSGRLGGPGFRVIEVRERLRRYADGSRHVVESRLSRQNAALAAARRCSSISVASLLICVPFAAVPDSRHTLLCSGAIGHGPRGLACETPRCAIRSPDRPGISPGPRTFVL